VTSNAKRWTHIVDDSSKKIVAAGYDQIADAYAGRFRKSSVRDKKLAELVEAVPCGGAVLDLGCGDGVPTAESLVLHGCHVIGVDASRAQIERARRNVPGAHFVLADMTSMQFAPETFDAVAAFYSITHVPSSEHEPLIRNIASWLRPGGLFIASYGIAEGDWSGAWLGVPMFFSHSAPEATRAMIRKAGLRFTETEIIMQDNEDASFLWISAEKE
jgi:SAM-dependent methyltransferase